MVWTFGKTFSLEAFAYILGIILARKLFPSDYGNRHDTSILCCLCLYH